MDNYTILMLPAKVRTIHKYSEAERERCEFTDDIPNGIYVYPKGTLVKHNNTGKLRIAGSNCEYSKVTPQHLHILSDGIIEYDDWYIKDNIVEQCKAITGERNQFINGWSRSNCKKVVASTDNLQIGLGMGSPIYLTKVPESFVKEYIEAGGIDKVRLELDNNLRIDQRGNGYFDIAVTPDDEVIILPMSKKSYTREELEEIVKSSMKRVDELYRPYHSDNSLGEEEFNSWIKNIK